MKSRFRLRRSFIFPKHATNRVIFSGLVALIGMMLLQVPAYSLPSGNQVTSGSAVFSQSGNLLTIKQGSDKLITNWKSFSIGSAETTQFIQPSAKSAALNRVTGGASSLIDGKLIANGRVVLINPAGIAIGATGVVNVNSFTASTQDITNADFLNDGEDFFSGNSQAGIQNLGTIQASGGDAILIAKTISNSGKILAPSGTVGLAAGTQVLIKPVGEERIFIQPGSQKGGSIAQTLKGNIQAATAEVKAAGNPYATAINLSGILTATGATKVTPKILVQGGNGNIQINTDAKVIARSAVGKGGTISINANASGVSTAPVALNDFVTVTVAGSLDAAGTGFSQTGGAISMFGDVIRLVPESRLDVSGSADAGKIHLEAITQLDVGSGGTKTSGIWANSSLGNGGTIHLLAGNLGAVLIQPSARISASLTGTGMLQASKSGGAIRIGGGFGGAEAGIINAGKTVVYAGAQIASNGGNWGNGGRIAVWSDTSAGVFGSFQAKGGTQMGNGGFVEISAKGALDYQGITDTTAPFGLTGTLLIDPTNILIKNATNLTPIYTAVPGTTSIITIQTLLANLALNNVIIETDASSVGYGQVFTGSTAIFGDDQYGKIVLVDDLVWDTGIGGATSLTLNAQGGILLLASIANRTGGNVNLNADINNQYGGDVLIGSGKQTTAISVESLGQINVSGQRISVLGSNTTANASAQIGNGNFINTLGGNISVTALGTNAPAVGALMGYSNLGAINNYSGSAAGSYAQIGSGGTGRIIMSPAGLNVISNITLNASNGAISAIASSGMGSYAQIGHGGVQTTLNGSPSTVNLTMNLTVNARSLRLKGGTGKMSYAQLGHGGYASVLNLRNKVITDTLLTLTGTNGIVLDVDAGFGQAANVNGGYAQIGLGGAFACFNLLSQSAFIRIIADGSNATLRVHNGVSGDNMGYVQIGHGGHSSTYGAQFLPNVSNAFDSAKNTVFSSAPITISATNGIVQVLNENGSAGATSQYARIGHGQTFSANEWSSNADDPIHVELSYGNINLTINAVTVSVQSAGSDARIGHGAGDLANIGHLFQSSTISVQASTSFVVDGAQAIIGSVVDGTDWDQSTTIPGVDASRRLILNLSNNVVFSNGAYAADGFQYAYYTP